MTTTALSQADALALANLPQSLATAHAPFGEVDGCWPHLFDLDDIVEQISGTWIFPTSIEGPVSLDIIVKFTRPREHFDDRTSRVLGKLREAPFPRLDENAIVRFVTAGITQAGRAGCAPRIVGEGQVQDVVVRAQWVVAGRRGKAAVHARVDRPWGWLPVDRPAAA